MADRPRASRAGHNPSLADVAALAGVSRGTVSNVLNHPGIVAPSTLERVQNAIATLGYVRNDAARALAAGKSKSIGFVSTNIENSLFVDMIHGAQSGSRDANMTILIGNSADDLAQQNAYLDLFDEARVAGVLLAPMEDPTDGIKRMRSHGRQLVLLNYRPHDHDCCVVLVDNEQVGYLAARHLIDRGCTRLVYLASHENWQPVHYRRLGVRRAVAESGGTVTLQEVDKEQLDFANGAEYAAQFLLEPTATRADGVVAVTDELANGFMDGVVRGGLSVPRDVAIVGCENNRAAPRGPVSLTTVEMNGEAMGLAATSLLIEEISVPADEHEHRVVMLEPVLVPRASTFGTYLGADSSP
ncbi:LacI family DNA-binding transcriptional regulator [Lacisediminihabitans changchengi]|uniref:LacI family DNA-binding transcriptional regulator n=1 Tax=Lacisediminihabitans changchengi TaxID=2787634 RepID=A0A934SKM6_9MICO|nr:LacI family DNA-binding transcriptional regulator [Lacisediminihabitans changchengi]MBK4347109.1 LacI family DNA-binding transcriptional regulator [Lacisediminihabitans changchengi]